MFCQTAHVGTAIIISAVSVAYYVSQECSAIGYSLKVTLICNFLCKYHLRIMHWILANCCHHARTLSLGELLLCNGSNGSTCVKSLECC